MGKISFDYSNALSKAHEYEFLKTQVQKAHEMLHSKTGQGNDYIGWVDYPTTYDKEEFGRIKAAAGRIKETADVLIVIGIGGVFFWWLANFNLGIHTVFFLLSY